MKLKVINLSAQPKLRSALATRKKRTARKTLTRKDVFIANVLRRKWNRCHEDGVVFAAYTLADALKRDNPKFDRNKFILPFRG